MQCQGSHVTSQAGSYILQWKCFDSSRSSFDLRSAHKSKIMYYTEVLQSDKFKYDSFVTSIITGPPSHSVGGQTSDALSSSNVVCNTSWNCIFARWRASRVSSR